MDAVPYRCITPTRQHPEIKGAPMFNDDHNAAPINPLPPVVWVLAIAIAGVELALQGAEYKLFGGPAAVGWRLEWITRFGFFDAVWTWMLDSGRFPGEHLLRFMSYLVIHGSFSHALFAVVFILAIGKMVAEAFSSLAFLAIFALSGITGALAYAVLLDTNIPLIGAFPGIYGLIGALTFMLWMTAKLTGTSQTKAFTLIAFLLGIQLFFKFVFGGGDDWLADIAGFATGFLLSFPLAPHGGERLAQAIAKVRRRR